MSTHWNYSNTFPCGRASAVADDSEPSGRASVSNATDAPLSGAHVSSYQTPYQIQHEWAENVARAKEQFRILVGCNEVLDVNGNRIRAQLRNLEGRRSELEFSVSGLISHQNQLAILNSTAETDLLAAKTSLEDLRAQHGHVEVTIREAQDQLARTTEAVTDRRVHLNTLQVEAERFQAAINERTSELATVGNALRVTQADVDRTRAALASDKAQLAATQVELRSAKDATIKENKQTEEAFIERKRVWASIDRARSDLEKLQASAVEERADAKRRLDDLRADIAKATEKKEAKKKELAEYIAEGKQKVVSVSDEIKKARAAHGVELASMEKKTIIAQTELNRTNEAVSAARRDLAQERLQLQEIRDVITRDAAYLERLRQETAVVHESKAQAEADLRATDEDLDKLAAMVADAEHELLHVQAARDKASLELYVIQEKIGQEASLATSDLVQRVHDDASIRTEAAYAFAEAQTDIQDTTHLTDVPQMDTLSNHGMYTHADILYAPDEHHL
jgi:chromosome segregation ATPase